MIVALVVGLMLPAPPGLTPSGKASLLVMAAAVALWSTEALPSGATGLTGLLLLALTGATPDLGSALAGFSRPTIFFLLGVLALGAATFQSGLAIRVADLLLALARGRGQQLYAQMIAGFAVLSLLLPSASTRGAILLPVYEQALERIGAPSLSPLHRAVMLGLASLNRLGSNALLTGGVTPVVAAGLIGGFTWTTWLIYMGLPVYALLALGALAVYLMCRPTPSPTALRPPPSVPADPSPRGPLSARERRTLLVAALVSVLWMLDWLHGWDPALPALLGAVLLVAPGPGSMSWRDLERGIGWSNLLLVGASLSLAQAMIRSGAAAWLADGLRLGSAPLVGRPIALAIGLVVGCLVLRALLPNITAYLTLLIPVTMQLAPDLGLNPLVCGMLVTIAGDSVLFYAAQSSSSFIVAERGHLLPAEVFRLAVIMSALVVVVLLAVALPYWAILGQPIAYSPAAIASASTVGPTSSARPLPLGNQR